VEVINREAVGHTGPQITYGRVVVAVNRTIVIIYVPVVINAHGGKIGAVLVGAVVSRARIAIATHEKAVSSPAAYVTIVVHEGASDV
jgi:hypothetical protein